MVMRVFYPRGEYRHQRTGAQWKHDLINSYDELFFAYKIRFGADFDFSLGGKLPGLAGRTANSGGNVPNGTDGWSGRIMWKSNGKIVQYVYHPDQSQNLPYGDDFDWEIGDGKVQIAPDTW